MYGERERERERVILMVFKGIFFITVMNEDYIYLKNSIVKKCYKE